jgi:hypothetical protein
VYYLGREGLGILVTLPADPHGEFVVDREASQVYIRDADGNDWPSPFR